MSQPHSESTPPTLLSAVVNQLCAGATKIGDLRWDGRIVLPSRELVLATIEGIRQSLFPGYFGTTDLHDESLHYYIGATLDRALRDLEEQLIRAIAVAEHHDFASCPHCHELGSKAVRALLSRLPALQDIVTADVKAALDGDPALCLKEEAIFSYPGIYAVTEQRIAHELYLMNVPLIPRIISEHAHSLTGIDIHPGATIGRSFFIDHGTGVVIGETSRIGDRVRIYQGVTLGAKSFPFDENGRAIKGIDRHPIVEDDVVIYAGATILGRVTIGKGSTIGGNVWLTRSVPPASRITQAEFREEQFDQGGGI